MNDILHTIFLSLSVVFIILLLTILIRYILKKDNERLSIIASIVFTLSIFSLVIGVVNTPLVKHDSKQNHTADNQDKTKNKDKQKKEEKTIEKDQNKNNQQNYEELLLREQNIQEQPINQQPDEQISSEDSLPNNIDQSTQQESPDVQSQNDELNKQTNYEELSQQEYNQQVNEVLRSQ